MQSPRNRAERRQFDRVCRLTAKMSEVEFARRVEDAPRAHRPAMLRARFRYRPAEFARYFWPDLFDQPFNDAHKSLFKVVDRGHYRDRRKLRSAVAAPRGIGKSTVASFAVPIHGVCYDLEQFIVMLSAGPDLAVELTEAIKVEFEENEKLAWVYGPFLVKGGKGDFRVQRGRGKSVRIMGRSARQPIRGPKHKGIRPTMVIIDDGERPDDVISPKMRVKQWNWLTKDVLKIGIRTGGGTHFYIRGTVLHVDSMLANCLKAPGWRSEKFRSIISWPDRQDLWHRCGEFYKDLTLGDDELRESIARAFYEAHRAEMDQGVEVLDPVGEPIFDLYISIWDEGLASFLQEKQNEPRDPSSSFFNSESFARFKLQGRTIHTADGRAVSLDQCRIAAWLDPIPGDQLVALSDDAGAGAGDYAAIAVVAQDNFGYRYVLDVWMRRCRDVDQLNALWELCELYGCEFAFIESNGFQRLFGRDFKRMRDERRAQGLYWQVEVQGRDSRQKKEDRIASLDASVTNGWLQFNETIRREVFAQFDEFPGGTHDDAPDAIEGAARSFGDRPGMRGEE